MVKCLSGAVGKSRVLTLKNLPFNVGEKVEVIIIPRSMAKQDKKL